MKRIFLSKSHIRVLKKIHLVLGFVFSIPVGIVALSGSLYSLQDEIQNLSNEYRWIQPEENPPLRVTSLRTIAELYLGDSNPVRIHQFAPDRSVALFFNNPAHYGYLFINPYNGEILHFQDFKKDFFGVLLNLHMYLLLPPGIGRVVVGWVCIGFFIILISGFLMWINWKSLNLWAWKIGASWKRKNFDIHRNLGIISFLFALIFLFTGWIWAFPAYENKVYKLLTGKDQIPQLPLLSEELVDTDQDLKIDVLWDSLIHTKGKDLNYTLYFPKTPSSPIVISVNKEIGTYSSLEFLAFNPKSGEPLPVSSRYGPDAEGNLGDRFLKRVYDIHTGGIAGLFGKTLALLASLTLATLPLTGILIWIGRKRKKYDVKKINN